MYQEITRNNCNLPTCENGIIKKSHVIIVICLRVKRQAMDFRTICQKLVIGTENKCKQAVHFRTISQKKRNLVWFQISSASLASLSASSLYSTPVWAATLWKNIEILLLKFCISPAYAFVSGLFVFHCPVAHISTPA